MVMTRLGYMAVKRESTLATAVKPSHFLRFKDGDLKFSQEVIESNPIQNNRRNALNPVAGKISTDASFNFDLDYNECVHWLSAALGGLSSSDISSGTDASVYRHTMTVSTSLPSLSVEQMKGDGTDTASNRQKYEVLRGYGVLVDQIKMSSSD